MQSSVLRVALLSLLVGHGAACADTFTYLDKQNQTQTIEARLVASGRGVHVLGKADGQYVVVAQEKLQKRVAGPDPVPITVEAMKELLLDEFGEDRLRIQSEDSYVVGLVLAGPLSPRAESKVQGFLRKVVRFMINVDRVFTRFCREFRIDVHRPEFPLVLLVFETDSSFNAYVSNIPGGSGLDAEDMRGVYSPLTNRLAIRMSECRTYQVPLHEAIHQQVYNRGVLQRLAEVPVWFNEGIATGFENDGVRIDVGPTKVNATYAHQVPQATRLRWEDIVANDATFRGDVLASEAYVHAWSLHWLLVTQHRRGYAKFIKRLGTIAPLCEQTRAERDQQFLECFGQSVTALRQDFSRLLQAQMKREQIPPTDPDADDNVIFADTSEVALTARTSTDEDGLLEARGTLTNVSPYRRLAYYVTLQTDGGLYAQWHLPSVKSLEKRTLNERLVEKVVDGGPGKTGNSYRVEVTCALPDSPEAERWRRGEFPPLTWEIPE